MLSKTKYLAGLQCPKRLWLGCHAPDLASPAGPSLAALFEMGAEIGRHAHDLFPGGVLIDHEAWEHGEAIARTRDLLANPTIPALFEAAFEHAGVRIRVDVLERLSGGTWGLREVKSGTSVKKVHLDDLAVQAFVLAGCGLTVPSIELVHVNGSYVRGEGDIDWPRLFTRVELLTEVVMRRAQITACVAALHDTLAAPAAPAIQPSPHCFSPHACEFWSHCTSGKPADWIFNLPRLRASLFAALQGAGVERIPLIPDDFPLSELHVRVRDAWRTGQPFVSAELARALDTAGPPAAYLDFETINPAIPLYPDTRPYEAVPFQWSLQHVDAAGNVAEQMFLADGRADPRRAFVESLLAAVGAQNGPIIVYSGFEERILTTLAPMYPERAPEFAHVISRLIDFLSLIRHHVYDPAFGRTFSLKSVAPALVPDFGYDELGLQDGTEASAAFLALASGMVDSDAEEEVRRNLLAYCKRDTEALVGLHRVLREMADPARCDDA